MIVFFLKFWTFKLFIIFTLIIFPTLAYATIIISDSELILPNFDVFRLVLVIILMNFKLSLIFLFLAILGDEILQKLFNLYQQMPLISIFLRRNSLFIFDIFSHLNKSFQLIHMLLAFIRLIIKIFKLYHIIIHLLWICLNYAFSMLQLIRIGNFKQLFIFLFFYCLPDDFLCLIRLPSFCYLRLLEGLFIFLILFFLILFICKLC